MRITTLALDLVMVLAFAVAGRASHYDTITLTGVLAIAWPFALGLMLASFVTSRTRWPLRSLRAGLLIWPVTLAAGMAVRLLTGQGTAMAFVLVATGVLGLGLLGWRAVGAVIAPNGSPEVERSPSRTTDVHEPDPTGGRS